MSITQKAILYEAFSKTGISESRFALDLGMAESEVGRVLNPQHGTRPATIKRALYRLGTCFSLTADDGISTGPSRARV